MIKRVISILLAAVVFLVGVICGFTIDRMLMLGKTHLRGIPFLSERIPIPKKLGNKFSKKLSLTDEQKGKLNRILEKNKETMRTLRKEMSPKFNEVRELLQTEIKSILNDEQKQKFDKMIKKTKGLRKKLIWRKERREKKE